MNDEYLYSREYEVDECSYRITINTTDYGAFKSIKNYAESVLSEAELVMTNVQTVSESEVIKINGFVDDSQEIDDKLKQELREKGWNV